MTSAKASRRATVADYAAIDFEPVVLEWKPPTNVEWLALANPYLVAIRLAWITVQKTKPELVEAVRSYDEPMADEMLDSFRDTLTFFRTVVTLIEDAEIRTLIAGSVIEMGAA